MPAPILATKLYIPPPRPKMVSRLRLSERISEGMAVGVKLTLISASAGFGKTTVVSEWLARCERPVAWLSLDKGDNDPLRFLTYLVATLQTLSGDLGARIMDAIQVPQPPPLDGLITSLLNEITTLSTPFVLVFDDYHAIEAREIDQALVFILEHQPPQMHLVITTREDPHLPLARLRARGQLTELRAADLRFTPAEAAEFLNRMMNLNLSEKEVSTLEARTEGWIAGLQMAALALQGSTMPGSPDVASFVQTFTGSHRFVLDYLMEEVLERQTSEVQTFLLKTSILDRLCGPLCDAVLGSSSAVGQEILKYLDQTNLFVVPLDNERHWYRFHHLFGDLLRQRLGKPAELPELHQRASRWYEENGDLSAAFHHALTATDFERAAHLTEAAWREMEHSFRPLAWLGWVKKLPHTVVSSRPWLCVQIGWAYSDVGELEPSETYLQIAEHTITIAGMTNLNEFTSIPGTIALIRAGNAQIEGDLAETVRYAELAVQLAPENDLLTRAQAAITLGFTHWGAGNLEASLQAMLTWIDDMQKLGNQMYAIASGFVVADMHLTMGHLGDAEKALEQTIQKAKAFGIEAEVVTAHHHLGLAMLAHERGNHSVLLQSLQTATDLGQHTTLIDWPHRWNLAQARLKESEGEWDFALQCLDNAQRGYVKNPIPILQPIAAHKARVYLRQGRLDKAQTWVRERSLSTTDKLDYLGEYEHLTLARVCLAEGSFSGVHEMLDRLLVMAEAQKRKGSVIEILITRALIDQAQGDHLQAFATLERILTLTEAEGYLRVFVDEGEPMMQLLSAFFRQNASRAHPFLGYVARILNSFPQLGETRMPKNANLQPSSPSQDGKMIEPLTERELEVLRLIAQGRSNSDISRQLYLALSTVKGHNLRIFDKLQVQNRTEAVARARALGLI
ncbi:MAG: helix-turn-helix transcriptional regulator [Anaerolineales bacterium]|nr:helix-turn-helix transcriptional regulator [Anaerolineales bacterium]